MPIRMFWLMNAHVHRIGSEEDLRKLHVAAGSQSGEGIREIGKTLADQMGEVMKLNPMKVAQLDKEGLNDLRALELGA